MDNLLERLQKERAELLNKIELLHKKIDKHFMDGEEINCPSDLLLAQLNCMKSYVYILDLRILYTKGGTTE